jgi:hypothetical protein
MSAPCPSPDPSKIVDLIGRPYELGRFDCLTLATIVVEHYGFTMPRPTRDWYRRLRRGDYSIFPEQLNRWGVPTSKLESGVVAQVRTDNGYCLASYWEEGWLSFVVSEVAWSPIDALPVLATYCQRK